MLAIIPARGGSKGLPGKNILPLLGKPLIGYTIEAALRSRSVDRVIVSTDSAEIADVASEFGAEVPFLRPADLAADNSLAIDNYIYTIERLSRESGDEIKQFIVLLPTSPLRSSEDINAAIAIFDQKKADSVVSVVKSHYPAAWIKKINKEGVLESAFPLTAKPDLNRQDEEDIYVPNGAIYVFKTRLLKETGLYYSDKTYPHIMPKERSVDIDTRLDFDLAELLMRSNHMKVGK